jgi:CHAT domain-containing protein
MVLRVLRECPECKHEFYFEIWQIIDLGENPGLRKPLLDGKINLPICPNCASTFIEDTPFLVKDPKYKRVIFFIPESSEQDDVSSISLLQNLLRAYSPKRKDYFKTPVIVTNWNKFLQIVAEYIDTIDSPKPQDFFQELINFIDASSWDGKRNVVNSYPELLSYNTSLWLDSKISETHEQGESVIEEKLVFARIVLSHCREVGPDLAFHEFMETMPINLGTDGSFYIEATWEPQELLDQVRLNDLERIEKAARDDPRKIPDLIALFEQALNWPVVAKDPALRAGVYCDLGAAYYNLGGGNAVRRLRRAVNCLNEALTAYTPETNQQRYADVQNQLGLAYMALPTYDQTENLQRAIACFGEALRFRTPETAPIEYAATQNNIGMACTRLETGDREANLSQSVAHFQEALRFYKPDSTPTEYTKVCNNLGTAYSEMQDIAPHYLQQAIDYYQKALKVFTKHSEQSWLHASILINLGKAYTSLQSQNPVESLHQSLAYYKEALQTLNNEKNPREIAITYEGLCQVFEILPDGDISEHRQQATEYYHKALDLLSPNTFPADLRRIAMALGNLYFKQQFWADAITAYREAIVANETLYRIAATDVSRSRELSHTLGLYSNLAYAQARLGYYDEAVVQLENSRTKILSEALLRDQASLKSLEPEDQAAFAAVRERIKELETEARTQGEAGSEYSTASSFTEISSNLRTARQELTEIMNRIHTYIPDFMMAGFTIQAIMGTATPAQPLVYLITTSMGSLALIVPSGVKKLEAEHAIWIDDFRDDFLADLLVNRNADGEIVGGYLVGQIGDDMLFLKTALNQIFPVLRDRLIGPLVARLVDLDFRQVTLIPGGRLSLLPLHAAFEPITVSYAPSARALQAAASKNKEQANLLPFLLGIGNPLPNPKPLAFACEEVKQIEELFHKKGYGCTPFYEQAAKSTDIVHSIPEATYLHLSCHGRYDVQEPLDSTLYLSGNDTLTLRDLLDGDLDLSKTRLAVLSACQTGITDFLKVPDEAVGFPAGFIQAGVPGVISTLWPVDDISTALLMEKFYQYHLMDSLDPGMALHKAQNWLRDATAEQMILAYYYKQKYMTSGKRDQEAFQFMRYYQANPQVKPFEHPYYWAGFIFSGV